MNMQNTYHHVLYCSYLHHCKLICSMQQHQPGAQLSKSSDNCRRLNQSDGTFYLHVFAINAMDAVMEIPHVEKVIPNPGKMFLLLEMACAVIVKCPILFYMCPVY